MPTRLGVRRLVNVKTFLTIFGIAALYGAVRFGLGIWLPKRRGYWGGAFTGRPSKNDPDALRVGTVSSAAGAILWGGVALACFASLFGGATPKPPRIFMAPI